MRIITGARIRSSRIKRIRTTRSGSFRQERVYAIIRQYLDKWRVGRSPPHESGGTPPITNWRWAVSYMLTVYIMRNESTEKYYIGFTSNIRDRLKHHNSGASRFTRGKGPWKLVYQEHYQNKREAWLREKQIKSYKGGNAFKKLIAGEV